MNLCDRESQPFWMRLTFLAGALFFAPCAAQTAPIAEVERFFESGVIPHVKIEITESNLTRLQGRPRDYVRATVREGGKVFEEVGIHLKGAAGSFQRINDSKPAFTLNFDKFVDDQHFHGLDKLSLNNSVQDPTYLTEALCSELFLAAGVPTPRTTHAHVSLNGRHLGLYVLKEGFDKTFLKRHFRNAKGNLYDGGFLQEIDRPLERTSGEGDVRGRADLKALVEAAQLSDATERLIRLEAVLDVERFLSFAALEMLTWHWDGYLLKRNNYRVYHDPSVDKLIFMPHGMDQMFWDPNGPVVPQKSQTEGLVARALLDTGEGKRRYRERVSSLLTNVFTVERITNRIQQLHARLRPALESVGKDTARNHDRAVTNLMNAVLQRVRRAELLINQPEPERLRFDAAGVAPLLKWHKLDIRGTGILDEGVDPGGLKTLQVTVGPEGRCTASWRTRVTLRAGTYIFEGRVRTAGVVPLEKDSNSKGIGAGLRQSQKLPRQHGFVGDNEWQTAEHQFVVPEGTEEVSLICELRGEKGQAWFDLGSLRLRKKAAEPVVPAPIR